MCKLRLFVLVYLLLFSSTLSFGSEFEGNVVLKNTKISISEFENLTKESPSIELRHVDLKSSIQITLYSIPQYDKDNTRFPYAHRYFLKVVNKRDNKFEQSAFDLGQVGQIMHIARLIGGTNKKLITRVSEYPWNRYSKLIKNYEIEVSIDRLQIQEVSDIPKSINSIISIGSWKDTEYNTRVSPHYRFRAVSYDGGYEGMPFLEVEKTGIRFNNPLYWKFRIDVTSNPKTSKESSNLKGERSIGCCRLRNIRWTGLVLNYEVLIGEKKFECVLPYLAENEFDVHCSHSE